MQDIGYFSCLVVLYTYDYTVLHSGDGELIIVIRKYIYILFWGILGFTSELVVQKSSRWVSVYLM